MLSLAQNYSLQVNHFHVSLYIYLDWSRYIQALGVKDSRVIEGRGICDVDHKAKVFIWEIGVLLLL